MMERRYRNSITPGNRFAWIQRENHRHSLYQVKENEHWKDCMATFQVATKAMENNKFTVEERYLCFSSA